MSDKPVLQLNFKVGNAMVNAYADSPEEAESLLDWVNENGDAVIKVQTMLDATHAVAAGLGGQSLSQSQGFSGGGGGGAPQGGAAPCDHGSRVFKQGTNKTTGKPWQGYFCPSNVDGCKPVWSKG